MWNKTSKKQKKKTKWNYKNNNIKKERVEQINISEYFLRVTLCLKWKGKKKVNKQTNK